MSRAASTFRARPRRRPGAGLTVLLVAAVQLAPTWPAGVGRADAADKPTDKRDVAVRLGWLRVGRQRLADTENALSGWAHEARLRTSVDLAQRPAGLDPADPRLLRFPLLYWGGASGFGKLKDDAIARLREHLSGGGLLIIDNRGRNGPDTAFDRDIRATMRRVFGQEPAPIPAKHVIYRTFYRLDAAMGRRADQPQLEGIALDGRYAVIMTHNDLAGAFARAAGGGYALPAVPGGEFQRERAFRLAINLVLYALCLDYKDDATHVEHLRRRRGGP